MTSFRGYLCAWCGKREADTVDQDDGREIPACSRCVDEPVPDPPAVYWHQRILATLRHFDEVSFSDLREVLGLAAGVSSKREAHQRETEACGMALRRLVRDGLVSRRRVRTAEGTELVYSLVREYADGNAR